MSLVVSAGAVVLWLVLLGLRPALGEAPQMQQDPVAQTVVQNYLMKSRIKRNLRVGRGCGSSQTGLS
jgi:hypothetical protein